jgi:S-adenosylmethionine:tRNA ribosyltransferase-isomerase
MVDAAVSTEGPVADPVDASPLVRLSDYDYELPDDRIAQHPVEPRDSARLLVVPRGSGALQHKIFRDLPEFLTPDDLLVVNETRVSAVRLFGNREPSGGAVEVLLLRPSLQHGVDAYAALVRPGRKIAIGDTLLFAEAGLSAEVLDRTADGGRVLRFNATEGGDVTELLEVRGRVPLPPYITAPLADKTRYQTVYAKTPGSAAAPTAGLHFTPELLAQIAAMGVKTAKVRLDVGLGTFRPIRVDDVTQHEMHTETFAVSPETADMVNSCRGRVIAVGTTTVRALETAAQIAQNGQRVAPTESETSIFIYPGGHPFRAVDTLVTNFHQPHSTLLLLVAAFVGGEQMRRTYQTALTEGYRFLSFGDAMLAL